MIASLTGRVAELGAASLVLDVHGVGWLVQITPTHALSLRSGSTVTVATRMVVREDAMTLYGFRDQREREVFDLLVAISGVGPKSALGVIAQLDPDALARAVADDDDAAFKKVSGVGPKTAKLILLQLKGRLAPVAAAPGATPTLPIAPSMSDDVIEALIGLGTPAKTAAVAVAEALEATGDDAARITVPDLLRAALGRIGPRR